MKSNRKKAFTLVEMLTVIAIIGILAGFLLPTLKRARDKAKMAKCANNLLQLVHGIDLFKIEHEDYPDFLSNLYPSYIASRDLYLCPADYCLQGEASPYNSHVGADGGVPWWLSDPDEFPATDDTKFNTRYASLRNSPGGEIDYCSYFYEFCGAPSYYYQGYTWKEAGKDRMAGRYHGNIKPTDNVPIVRCFWHQKRKGASQKFAEGIKEAINVAAKEKNVYYSDASKEEWWR